MGEREAAIGRELTKLHEEVTRGAIVLAHPAADTLEPRGEIVIVVARRGRAEDERHRPRHAAAAGGWGGTPSRRAVARSPPNYRPPAPRGLCPRAGAEQGAKTPGAAGMNDRANDRPAGKPARTLKPRAVPRPAGERVPQPERQVAFPLGIFGGKPRRGGISSARGSASWRDAGGQPRRRDRHNRGAAGSSWCSSR